jgi:predicted aspartyl protease
VISRMDKRMGRIAVDVDVANHEDLVMARAGILSPDKVRRVRVRGLVDTGASYLVLSHAIAKQLGVPAAGKVKLSYADRRRATRQVVEDVQVDLLGQRGVFKAIVEPGRTDALIGAIVLEDLDLLVDCRTQTLRPRDPNQITAELE